MILLYRIKDFCLKKVYTSNNKIIGIVDDIYLDIKNNKITGLKVYDSRMFSKKNFIDINKIILDDSKIIALAGEKREELCFENIKLMEVYDKEKRLKGVVEDILIDDKFNIAAIIVSSGIINNILEGKEILLMSECEYMNKYILFKGKTKILLKTLPHSINRNYDI